MMQWIGLTFCSLLIILIAVGLVVLLTTDNDDAQLNRISILGSGASVIGIIIAVYQTLKTRGAAIAAKDAAILTGNKMRNAEYKRLLDTSRHMLTNIHQMVMLRQWQVASFRALDFANHAFELANARTIQDSEWQNANSSFSRWSNIFNDEVSVANFEINTSAWISTYNFIQGKISREMDVLTREVED
jgi:hypothetical protein